MFKIKLFKKGIKFKYDNTYFQLSNSNRGQSMFRLTYDEEYKKYRANIINKHDRIIIPGAIGYTEEEIRVGIENKRWIPHSIVKDML